MAAPSSIGARLAPLAQVSAPREVLPEHPERAVRCTPRAARPLEHPEAPVPASASVPVDPDARVLVSVPARVERPDSCPLPAKRRARSAPAPTPAVDASNTPRPKKAR